MSISRRMEYTGIHFHCHKRTANHHTSNSGRHESFTFFPPASFFLHAHIGTTCPVIEMKTQVQPCFFPLSKSHSQILPYFIRENSAFFYNLAPLYFHMEDIYCCPHLEWLRLSGLRHSTKILSLFANDHLDLWSAAIGEEKFESILKKRTNKKPSGDDKRWRTV